jgi:hypothetical protein
MPDIRVGWCVKTIWLGFIPDAVVKYALIAGAVIINLFPYLQKRGILEVVRL